MFAIIMIIDDIQHPANTKGILIYDVYLIAGYISLFFRDLLVLLIYIQALEVVKNSDSALFSTRSPRYISIYSTYIDNDEEKYWKHDKKQMFTRKNK